MIWVLISELLDFQSAINFTTLKNRKFKKLRLNRLYLYLTNLSKKYFDIPGCYFKNLNSHLYTICCLFKSKIHSYRDQLMEYLLSKGIETNIHYIPNSSHSFYKKI